MLGGLKLHAKNVKADREDLSKHISYRNVSAEIQRLGSSVQC